MTETIVETRDYLTEAEFKKELRDDLINAGHWSKREYYVGTLAGNDWCKSGVSGFIDLVSVKTKWFAECKLSASTAALTRGLGQCLFYKHFLKEFRAFLVYPTEGNGLFFETDLMRDICWGHGVVLTCNRGIEREINRWIAGKPPFFAALNDYTRGKPDRIKAMNEFYEMEGETV